MTEYDTRAASAYDTRATSAPGPSGSQAESSTGDQVKEQVAQTAEVAKDRARGVTAQARGRLRDQVDQRSTQAGERIAGTAQDVRSVADELRRQDREAPARLAEQVADRADRVGDYLKAADGDRILRDAERFARDNPWLVAGGGLVLGFAASRFLKASSSRRYHAPEAARRPLRPEATWPPEPTPYPAPPTTGVDATLDPAYPAPPAAPGADPLWPEERLPRRQP
jgi:hypothetical protein